MQPSLLCTGIVVLPFAISHSSFVLHDTVSYYVRRYDDIA